MRMFALLISAATLVLMGSAQSVVQIGTGTILNTTTTYPAPYGNWYWGSRHQYIYLASELNAAGIGAGPINHLAWEVTTLTPTVLLSFNLGMANTTATTAGAWIPTSPVLSQTNFPPQLGWNTHNFSCPFIWDGVSNLVVESCSQNGSFTNNCVFSQSATPFVSTREFHQDAAGVCASTGLSLTYSQRPNIRFGHGVPVAFTYQTNQAQLGLKINNTTGGQCTPTVVTQPIYACAPPAPVTGSIGLDTTLLGMPWDIGISSLTLVPAGITLSDGQLVNLNLGGPLTFINGGLASAFPVFPGIPSLSLQFSYSFGGQTDFSIQSVAIDPSAASGLRLSQATEYHGNLLPATPFIAGPTADTVGTLVNFVNTPNCYVSSIPFYGVNYTQFYVQSNGRITFSTSNTSAIPTAAAALTAPPSVGFWTDLNPGLAGPGGLGTVNVTNPAVGLISVNYTNIPYAGEPTTANTFSIIFDNSNGSVTISGLTGIVPNPQTVLGTGDAQWLGICRGSLGSTDPGNTIFSPGGSGTPPAANSCWRDFYTQIAGGAGLPSSLIGGTLGSIVFIPSLAQPGNYDYYGF